MILIVCNKCSCGLQVVGEPSEVDHLVGIRSGFWPDKYTCFRCSGTAAGYLTAEVSQAALSVLDVKRVTSAEAFIALNGLGIPEERTCCEEVLLPLLRQCGVRVVGKPAGGTYYVIDELVLPDGTRVCLGASPKGAVVYRIVKPHSYTDKVGA